MKLFSLHTAFLLMIVASATTIAPIALAQFTTATGVQNSGRMVNIGTMSIAGGKNFISSPVQGQQGQPATLVNAAFGAEGTLILSGSDNTFTQDSLAGLVAYIQDDTSRSRTGVQRVQPLTYTKLALLGSSLKIVQATQGQALRNIVCADSLLAGLATDSIPTRIQILATLELQARGAVFHYASIAGVMRLAGTQPQSMTGTGFVTNLVMDNPMTVRIAAPAQIRVGSRLDLVRGELQNAADANLTLGDTALITRTSNAALRSEPVFGRAVSVRYTGSGAIVTGGELPSDSTRLQRLECLSTGGITLGKSVTVNDSLILAASLRTGANTLTFRRRPTLDNPTFLADTCEIIGSFQRFFSTGTTTGASADTAQRLMNNIYTFVQFPFGSPSSGSQGSSNPASMTLRITPDVLPEPNNDPTKIRRGFAFASTGLAPTTLVRVGYGWRLRPRNETNGLQPAQILLQRWNASGGSSTDGTWQTVGVPQNPQASWQLGSWNTRTANNFWTTGVADSIPASQMNGFFALGLDANFSLLPATTLNIRAILEGASLQPATGTLAANALMHNTLQRLSLLPSTLPEQYPFTLLGARRTGVTVAALADSVVDWMVLELRRNLSRGADSVANSLTSYPALLKQNGMLTGLDGRSLLTFRRSVYDSTRSYYVALHHRNHLPVVTTTRLDMSPNATLNIDFTQPTTSLGGADAVKFIGNDDAGRSINALLVGDVNADGLIGRTDYDTPGQSVWAAMFAEGYLPADADMNGVVTTADMNRIWNNRGRQSRLTPTLRR
jgi:hypothetical protein